ncbi:MAG TPA: choice-of-anchor tandem repeat GloVer-containing protein [Terriglobales bacterium]|nr:choice-of-anchor tandem repeat GloVer-containing protein [Terriglobales bacterium]
MRPKTIVVLTFLLFSISSGHAARQKVLYAFTGGLDGKTPYAGVIIDPAGNLYGVTEWGGLNGMGTVFQLTPTLSAWTETVLYNFTGGPDGDDPIGGLAIDEAGNLYGTTAGGGDPFSSCGTVFKLSPSTSGWTFTVLHAFTSGTDGCIPGSSLRYNAGTLYGTTVYGGRSNQGTAFRLPTSGGSDFNAAFSLNNGDHPWGGINSWSYGTTYNGGKYGTGNVYEWTYGHHLLVKRIFSPTSGAGHYPLGELLNENQSGELKMYGTTSRGGVGGSGTVYRLTESPYAYDVWYTSVLHSFSGPDGASPSAGLVMDPAGNLYGTTSYGGADPGFAGTVFKLTPGLKNKWTYTLLYSFTGGTDGGQIYSGVILDSAGNLYGTAISGGSGNGVVYEVTP